jgi:hypothetical protein
MDTTDQLNVSIVMALVGIVYSHGIAQTAQIMHATISLKKIAKASM